MAASAFHYVWPTTGILRARLAACFLLVMAERAINLAAPVAFKHMVEVLGDVTTAAAAAAAANPEAAGHGPLSILQMGARSLLTALAGQGSTNSAHLAALTGMSNNTAVLTATAASPPAGDDHSAAGVEFLAPFWVLFYPWAFIYLGAFFLRGGSGSEGLLTNIRDILYIPITQVSGGLVWLPMVLSCTFILLLAGASLLVCVSCTGAGACSIELLHMSPDLK